MGLPKHMKKLISAAVEKAAAESGCRNNGKLRYEIYKDFLWKYHSKQANEQDFVEYVQAPSLFDTFSSRR